VCADAEDLGATDLGNVAVLGEGCNCEDGDGCGAAEKGTG
jgi:hypothetical protein